MDRGDAQLAAAIGESIRDVCGCVEIEFVSVGSLPNDGKVIDDIRSYD